MTRRRRFCQLNRVPKNQHEWPFRPHLGAGRWSRTAPLGVFPQVETRLSVTSGPERRRPLDDPEHRHGAYGVWQQVGNPGRPARDREIE